jgi:hypothetical protein
VNSLINLATILSNQKSTARVNLLLTYCNCAISTGFHSNCLIRFVGYLSFNLNNHSCNKCGKSQKHTSCKSLKTYLSRYLRGVNLGFLLSFCTNSSFFVFNHLSISSFVGFHGLNISFYTFILRAFLPRIPSTQSYAVPVSNKTICWLYLSFTSWDDLGSTLNMFPTKPSKTIDPPGKPEGNAAHRVHCVVSPEIALWVTAMLKCLQSRIEWGFGVVSYLLHALILLSIQVFLGFIHL